MKGAAGLPQIARRENTDEHLVENSLPLREADGEAGD
jgi:hypothetical protein